MYKAKLALIAAATLCLCGCLTLPSPPPTVARQPPEACLKDCQMLPAPTGNDDAALRTWEYDVVDSYGECRRRHADCVRWHLKGLAK